MTLEKLQSELIQAKKNKDHTRNLVLSNMVGAVKKAAIDKNCRDNITEDMVNEVLLKQKKMVQEMIDTCPADRVETMADYKKQMEIVSEFAPTLITDVNQIEEIILNCGYTVKLSNRGSIMKYLSTNFKGKMDMSIASKVLGGMLL